jgi:hypothetical protein
MLAVLFGVLAACEGAGPPVPARVIVSPAADLATEIGAAVLFAARVEDERGSVIPGAQVVWSTDDPAVATADPHGWVTARAQGTAVVTAVAGGVSGGATLDVYLPPARDFAVGSTHLGRNGYVEFEVGDLPLIIAAPHGGAERPDEIADRTWGVTSQDRNTMDVVRRLAAALELLTGKRPHLVLCHLHRSKLDANREVTEAAQDNPFAEWAWTEYHAFIDTAKARTTNTFGDGLYLDIHGHGHEVQRLELGYLLTGTELALTDAALEAGAYATESSVRALVARSDSSFASIVRGAVSLGGLLAAQGYRTVPSPAEPDPGGAPYFSGGYSTARHGSRDGGSVSAVQVEANWEGVRDTQAGVQAFADSLGSALLVYFDAHFGSQLAIPALPRAGTGSAAIGLMSRP